MTVVFFIFSLCINLKTINMTTNPHLISLAEAAVMTHAYQNATQFQGMTVACMMDNNAYQQVMTQPGCNGVRTYFALDDLNNLTIVVVGVDAQGNDISSGIIMERSYRCPILCHHNSPLMK
jgi:hypothetical protein